ncbi:MAG: c-type cytochrome [Gemmatimonadota bacterium]|jgi:mono/diheme cytochrome c family protein
MRGKRLYLVPFLTVASVGLWACGGSNGQASADPQGTQAAQAAPSEAPAEASAMSMDSPIEQQTPVPEGATAAMVSAGQKVFHGPGNCYTCHGQDAKGTPLAPDLTDNTWIHFPKRPTLAEVDSLVHAGVAKPKEHPAPMPPMGGASLSDKQVKDVAAYVLSLSMGSK